MKQVIIAFLLVTVIACSVACSKNKDKEDKDNSSSVDAEQTIGEIPAMLKFSEGTSADYYHINENVMKEYVVSTPVMNVYATKLAVLKFNSNVSKADVEGFFDERQNFLEKTWKNYLPEQCKLVQNSRISTNSKYGIYEIDEKTGEAIKAFINMSV
ncbi:MAG: DUF4358 domain-containing protein [Clostridiales bacterium]|nr:DUF4358 domain-containing protein [Clostridiales bacterium]